MKIVWLSDSPAGPTGFGMASRYLGSGLAARGHEVCHLAWGDGSPASGWQGVHLGPTRVRAGAPAADNAGHFVEELAALRPDVLVSFADPWHLDFLTTPVVSQALDAAGVPWLAYVPVDGDDGTGHWPAAWLAVLARADAVVSPSRHGRDVLARGGLAAVVVPHGVDTQLFRPAEDRVALRRRLGVEGRFVVLSDARNQPRKGLPRLLEGFARFAAGRPDAFLHLHCDPRDPAAGSRLYNYRIDRDVAVLGLSDRVRFTRGFSLLSGLPVTQLVELYQAADVHVLTSLGEGFGLPSLQAAACGVVPLAPAHSASPELCLPHGVTVALAEQIHDTAGIARGVVDVDDLAAQLAGLYADREALARRAGEARRFALGLDWAPLVERWDDLLRSTSRRARATATTVDASSVFRDRPTRLDVPLGASDGRPRTRGAVYLPVRAPRSLRLLARLRLVLPGLAEVHTLPPEGPEEPLARCGLAVDIDGAEPDLPRRAAALGVPLLGLSATPAQAELWPELTMRDGDDAAGLRLARDALVDPVRAARWVRMARAASHRVPAAG